MDSVLDFDRKHLWHPYTSIDNPLPVIEVASADGVRLKLANGQELIDGMSSWWAVIHGYNHPVLVTAIKEQANILSHVMFGGITHKPAVDLGKLLVQVTPDELNRVFLCDSGSVAVEVAMKMAMQYFFAQKKLAKKKFLTIRSGYHGDTFHAMSVCDPVTGMHQIYSGVLPQYYFADKPRVRFGDTWQPDDLRSIIQLIEMHHDQICAVILEPVVQGAGGMNFYHPQYLKGVKELCQSYDILFIADEIATGFGRTGTFFGCDHAQISPDIMCLGKALTGGYMTLAAVLTSQQVGEVISAGEPHVFMHGPTFMGNPLACKVACASIELLLESDWQKTIKNIESRLLHGLEPCRSLDGVKDVRVLGAIGVVELAREVDLAWIQQEFIQRGVWIRPFGKLVYLMPPFCIEDQDIDTLTGAVVSTVSKLAW